MRRTAIAQSFVTGICMSVLAGCATNSASMTPAAGSHVSWTLPNAKNRDLVYVSNFYGSNILAFTYPMGKAAGTITGVPDPQGMCTSATSQGNWWVAASGASEVLEFAHGGSSPIATLSVSAGEPATCALDAVTGDLAVTILGTGNVVVFKNGQGSGETHATNLTQAVDVAYDPKGDLFVDGTQSGSALTLLELRKGRSSFESIGLNQTINGGAMQWYGKYLVILSNGALNRFAIQGKKGKFTGKTPAGNWGSFWIAAGNVAAVKTYDEDAAIYSYPRGTLEQTLTGSFDLPIGVVVSRAK